jgi:hypothetical protein
VDRVSVEEDAEEDHTIAPDGYDQGRDELVASATSGTTSFNGITYSATAENITGLLQPGSAGINHGGSPFSNVFLTYDICIGIAIDGIVVLLTISVV